MENLQVRLAEVNDAPQIAKESRIVTWQFAYRGQMPDAFKTPLSVEDRTKFGELSTTKYLPAVWTARER